MAKYTQMWKLARFHLDPWIDTIHIVGVSAPILRLITSYRYKTSELSGDEWRVSYVWQCTPEMASQMGGDLAASRDPNWFNFDGPYGSLEAGCAALLPGLYGNQPQTHHIMTRAVDFFRKGRQLYHAISGEQPMPLLMTAGHLSWALVMAGDGPLGANEAWDDMCRLCHQIGCAEPAVSTYGIKQLFTEAGEPWPRSMEFQLFDMPPGARLVRRFCPLHLHRGDSDLEDADDNYDVLEGPGPEDAVGWREYESRAGQQWLTL